MANDGSDLAAAIATIQEIGDNKALDESVADAFPGSEVQVANDAGRFSLRMQQHGILRALDAAELSDGTLRYLLWIAALLTPRPPALMVLNEPETSLHPDLIDALARLIVVSSKQTQLWITTHSKILAERIEEHSGVPRVRLEMRNGETAVGSI